MTNGFNFDALHKAYETGILNKEDFASDEEWALAMDIFTEQISEELEIPEVQEVANDHTNPNNWGLSPLRDAALRRRMAQDPDWDAKQLSVELDPEIDRMINDFNNRNVPKEYENGVVLGGNYLFKTEAEKQHDIADSEAINDISINGSTRYFGDFQNDYQDFDWDNDYTEVGFPDGQFLGNGLGAEGSAFLAECWRSHNTDGANDYIEMIADDELRERISRVYDLCDSSDLIDRSTVEFIWEQETLSDVCDDAYGLHS